MNVRRFLIASGVALGISVVALPRANAVTTALANWKQGVHPGQITWLTGGPGLDATFSVAFSVDFTGFDGLPTGVALWTVTGHTTLPAAFASGTNPQEQDIAIDSMTFTGADFGSGTTWLTLTAGSAGIGPGSTGGQFTGTPLAGTFAGDSSAFPVTLSSPYNAQAAASLINTYTFSFSNIDVGNPTLTDGIDILDWKGSNVTGNISYTPSNTVPEPGTLAMLIGTGVGGSLFAIRRRRA